MRFVPSVLCAVAESVKAEASVRKVRDLNPAESNQILIKLILVAT